MAMITIDTAELVNPHNAGFVMSIYMYSADDIYELAYDELPLKMQVYFQYLDSEERELFVAVADKDTGIVLAEFNGDRAILDGDTLIGAPYYFKEHIWLEQNGESLRFSMDIERKHAGFDY